jgi:uncharacterized protein
MRLVLDTNVLIAALITRGVCADLLEHCVLRHTIISSEVILSELRKHLAGKFKYSAEEADEAVDLLRSQMEIVVPRELEEPVCRDRDDDWILGTAIAGDVECIVTGDKDILIIGHYRGIETVSPSDFGAFEMGSESEEP